MGFSFRGLAGGPSKIPPVPGGYLSGNSAGVNPLPTVFYKGTRKLKKCREVRMEGAGKASGFLKQRDRSGVN